MLQALRALDGMTVAGDPDRPADGKAAGSAPMVLDPLEEPLSDPAEAARADLFAEMVDRQRQATSESIDRLLSGVLRSHRRK
ncbi:hypothetical protein [Tistlia consotensis]|nr:hypothetical protein [Tistlia consotensis]